jgi:hypothetical protein
MNGPENDLSSTLQRQAEQFARRGGHDLDLAQVVSRAGEISRGRRMRATMVMAAVVLAVAAPVGVTVLGNDPTDPRKVDPAAVPDYSTITLDGLEPGNAPATGYAANGEIHDGAMTVGLGEGGEPRALARIDGGFLVARQTPDGDLSASFIGVNRAFPARSWPTTGSFAVSAEGNVGAFVQPDGWVRVIQDQGDGVYGFGDLPGDGFQVVGIDGEDCSDTGDCTVYVQTKDENPKLWAVSATAEPTEVHPGMIGAVGITDDLVAGQVSYSGDGSCSEVRTRDNAPLWKTCDYRFSSFSPSGGLLLGAQAYGDGLGDGQLSVLDARTQQVVLDLKTDDGTHITSATWEDDDHILATVFGNGRWSVIRFALNGAREYALSPVAGEDTEPPFLVASH